MSDSPELSERDRIPVYAALLASDNAATGLVLQVTVNLTVACATYLTASLIVLTQASLAPGVIALIPIPVYLMQMYQLVLAGSVRRRTESTREIEWKLVTLAGLGDEYRDGYRIGSRATEAATDPHIIGEAPGRSTILKWMSVVAAVLPYVGFYALGIGYTFYVIGFKLRDSDVLRHADVSWWWWLVAIGFGLAWLLFAFVAWSSMLARLDSRSIATIPASDTGNPLNDIVDANRQASVDVEDRHVE